MRPFPTSYSKKFVLVTINYVSKWVEIVALSINDARVVIQFLTNNIFIKFGILRAIISDGRKHFCYSKFKTLLIKYGVSLCSHPKPSSKEWWPSGGVK